jgi:hypothetical protein
VGDRVGVSVGVGDSVGVSVGVGDGVGVSVGVGDSVGVSVGVGDSVGMLLGVGEFVGVAVRVGVLVAVGVNVGVGVSVGVFVNVGVLVAVGVGVGVAWTPTGRQPVNGALVNEELELGARVLAISVPVTWPLDIETAACGASTVPGACWIDRLVAWEKFSSRCAWSAAVIGEPLKMVPPLPRLHGLPGKLTSTVDPGGTVMVNEVMLPPAGAVKMFRVGSVPVSCSTPPETVAVPLAVCAARLVERFDRSVFDWAKFIGAPTE